MSVAANIKRLRKEKGVSPEALAVKLGCTVQQLYNYELGRTRITEETIKLAAQALGVKIAELFKTEVAL